MARVNPHPPAAESGLRSGDVIRTAGGQAVRTPVEFQRALVRGLVAARNAAPGDERTVQVEVERRGQRKTITLHW